jgi:hypothetical protein
MANQCSLLVTVSEEKHKPNMNNEMSHPLPASPINDQDAEYSHIILPIPQSIQELHCKLNNSEVMIHV